MNKELLQQALNALEYHTQQTRPIHNTDLAIEALRTELAKPEPVPVATLHDDGYWTWIGVLPYESSFAGWRMNVYTKDQL